MSRVLIALALFAAVAVTATPSGFLLAMVPDPAASNHLFSYAISPVTGEAKQLQEDYLMASVANTMNGGQYNAVTKTVQFVGQSLTMDRSVESVVTVEGPVPNPIMNFLVSVDATGDFTSKRMISYGGLVLGVRTSDAGVSYGMEQASSSQDARVDIVEDTGRCTNFYNTTATAGYIVGYTAIDSVNNRFFVGVNTPSKGVQLQTINLATGKLISKVDLPNPSAIRTTLCYDTATHGLFSLERLATASVTSLVRIDPATGTSTTIASLNGKATTGDCRSGTFFAAGSSASNNFVSTVDLTNGAVTGQKLNVSPAPLVLLFFPQ